MEIIRLFEVPNDEFKKRELMELLKLKDDKHFREAYLRPALEAGFIAMTLPDKPNSRLQKYHLTELGKKRWNNLGEED